MTVKELIEKLKEYPEDMQVAVRNLWDDDWSGVSEVNVEPAGKWNLIEEAHIRLSS